MVNTASPEMGFTASWNSVPQVPSWRAPFLRTPSNRFSATVDIGIVGTERDTDVCNSEASLSTVYKNLGSARKYAAALDLRRKPGSSEFPLRMDQLVLEVES